MAVGISVEEFGTRIPPDGGVVFDWPFDDLVPTENYRERVGRSWQELSLLVGRVTTCGATAARMVLPEGSVLGNRVDLLFEDAAAIEPWRQMVGVSLVLAAERSPGPIPREPLQFKPQRIVAVEQPVTSPEYLQSRQLMPEFGFIQGVVSQQTMLYHHGGQDTLCLYVPQLREVVTVGCHGQPRLETADGTQRDVLYARDVVRADVTRTFLQLNAYSAGNAIRTIGYCSDPTFEQ